MSDVEKNDATAIVEDMMIHGIAIDRDFKVTPSNTTTTEVKKMRNSFESEVVRTARDVLVASRDYDINVLKKALDKLAVAISLYDTETHVRAEINKSFADFFS